MAIRNREQRPAGGEFEAGETLISRDGCFVVNGEDVLNDQDIRATLAFIQSQWREAHIVPPQ